MKKIVISLLLVLLVAGGAWAYGHTRRSRDAQQAWQTVAVRRGTLRSSVTASGTVRGVQSAVIPWQVQGIVGEVKVSLGDVVAQDQPLALLRDDSWPQALLNARISLLTAQQQLDDLERNAAMQYAQALENWAAARQRLRTAEWRYNNIVRYWDAEKAQEEYDKWHRLVLSLQHQLNDPHTPPQMQPALRVQLEVAKQQEMVAKDNLEPSEEDKAKATADYELAKAEVAHWQAEAERWKDGAPADQVAVLQAQIAAAQATLDMATLKAPFSGTITDVFVHPGDLVSPGTPAFRLDALANLYVDAYLSELDIVHVAPGQPVSLTFDALPDRIYHGEVSRVALAGAVDRTGGNVNFRVTIRMTDTDENVHPEMTAAVTIQTAEINDALLVPSRAVRVRDGQPIVYLLRDGQPVSVEVTLGATSDQWSQVLSGDVQEGDLVILNPPTQQFDFFGGR